MRPLLSPSLAALVFATFSSTCLAQNFTWTQIAPHPQPAPFPRSEAQVTWDSAAGRAVLFGGLDGSSTFGDTWTWDGSSWQFQQSPQSPSPRYGHAMAYDQARQKVVLFGGLSGGGETWEWDGASWVQRFPATSPSSRRLHCMAYYPPTQQVILFGGFGSPMLADTWAWDGLDWVQLSPSFTPAGRSATSLAYDPVGQRLVMHGGLGGDPATGTVSLGDTWEFDGVAWLPVFAPSFPSARHFHQFVWDDRRQRLVLFAGADANSSFLSDTWELDGNQWQALSASAAPGGRHAHAMFYDPTLARTVVFGGNVAGTSPTGDMWINGTAPQTAVATTFGTGCGTPALQLTPDPSARPVVGQVASAIVSNAPTSLGGMAVGFSDTNYGPFPLPVPLTSIGMTNCVLWQSSDILGLALALESPGMLRYSLPIPNQINLIGFELFLQAYVVSPGENALSLVSTNAMKWVVGDI